VRYVFLISYALCRSKFSSVNAYELNGILTTYQRFLPNYNPTPPYLKKPLDYSYFPKEITPIPKTWVETEANLVFYREHEKVRLRFHFPTFNVKPKSQRVVAGLRPDLRFKGERTKFENLMIQGGHFAALGTTRTVNEGYRTVC
jgi:hypothetical protein